MTTRNRWSLWHRFGWGLLALVLAGCGASAPPQFYALAALAGPAADGSLACGQIKTVALINEDFPGELDRPQIVTRLGDNRLHLSETHQWANPLPSSFRLVLLENFTRQCPATTFVAAPWPGVFQPDRRVYLRVTRFDGTLGGEVVLAAEWVIADAERVLERVPARITVPVEAQGYEALVAAQSRALERLAGEITVTLARHP